MDNTLAEFEVVHHMKMDRHKSNNNITLKLDISKTQIKLMCVYEGSRVEIGICAIIGSVNFYVC